MKEQTLATFTTNNVRLQLVKLIMYNIDNPREYIQNIPVHKYQVRLNRKIIETSISEYTMRKLFATYSQNIILQLKIY